MSTQVWTLKFFHITLLTVLKLSWSRQPAINSKMLISVTRLFVFGGKDQILLLVHAAVILFVVLVSGLYYYKQKLNRQGRSCCWPCDYIGRHRNRPRSQAVRCRWRH